ncbi:MAG: hypothetical protein QOI81_1068 [Actinomycetota bacterium]|nr:hypothetical protein [Actinomycetota bacterium]
MTRTRILILLTTVAIIGAACSRAAAPRTAGPSHSTEVSNVDPDAAKGGGTDAEGDGGESASNDPDLNHAFTAPRWTGSLTALPSPGWTTEKVWNRGHDDWEPAIAADPNSPYVYTLTTRYGGAQACGTCPKIAIILRVSDDGGVSWGPDQYLCSCAGEHNQFDPIIEVDGNGAVHAAWLNGFKPGVTYSSSTDHGQTWSTPVDAVSSHWSDKPNLAVSADGQDVYIAFNGSTRGDSHIAVSHDGGATFTDSVAVDSGRYYFAGGAWTSANGDHVVFAQSDNNQHYSAGVHIDAIVSDDAGATWSKVRVASGHEQPDCTSTGCYDGFYGPMPALAGDADGNLVMAYSVNKRDRAPERLRIETSSDFGMSWHHRETLSPNHGSANALFPAMAATGHGDFRVWWMDTRTGHWNVWYRASTDAGLTWSHTVRLSNASGGAPYKGARGFREAYGDYGEMDITNAGKTVAIWGEGPSYYGPGGSWFIRQT